MHYTILAILLLGLSPHIAAAQSNFYVFGVVGSTDADANLLNGRYLIDDAGVSYTFGAGYEFTRHVSLEGAYHDFGSQHGRLSCPPPFLCPYNLPNKAEPAAFTLSVTGSFSLNDRLDMYGRLGVAAWDIEFESPSPDFDDSGENVYYGLGLRWSFDDHWKLRVEYGHADLDVGQINFHLHTVGIGLRYDL